MVINDFDLWRWLNREAGPKTGALPDEDEPSSMDRLKSLKLRTVKRWRSDDDGREVKRIEFFFLVEDILHDTDGASRSAWIGEKSPFTDAASSSTGFNAAMNALKAGVLEPDEAGRIRPGDELTRPEAETMLRNLAAHLESRSIL
ncbi:MAG: S-layer homology domain-containing protein [Pseudomonadales bacterium]|nr:S-layer homology domain-containing protein [Pseudomonadales bacterium]